MYIYIYHEDITQITYMHVRCTHLHASNYQHTLTHHVSRVPAGTYWIQP